MDVMNTLYLVSTAAMLVTVLLLVAIAVRAYMETSNRTMLQLTIGFTFIAAAKEATAVSAYKTDFANPQRLLLVDNAIMTVGFLILVYSLLTYGD